MQSARANQLEIVAKTKWCHKKIYHISPSSSCTISADKGETTATAAAKAEANVKLTNQLLESWEIQQSYQEAQRLLMLVSYFSTLTFYPGDTRFFWLKIFLIFVFSWAKKSKKPINSIRISLILLLDFFFFHKTHTVWGWEVCSALTMTPWRMNTQQNPSCCHSRLTHRTFDAWIQVERPPHVTALPLWAACTIRPKLSQNLEHREEKSLAWLLWASTQLVTICQTFARLVVIWFTTS